MIKKLGVIGVKKRRFFSLFFRWPFFIYFFISINKSIFNFQSARKARSMLLVFRQCRQRFVWWCQFIKISVMSRLANQCCRIDDEGHRTRTVISYWLCLVNPSMMTCDNARIHHHILTMLPSFFNGSYWWWPHQWASEESGNQRLYQHINSQEKTTTITVMIAFTVANRL